MKNLFDISGKVAVVTGGSRGIGAMIARGFVENGVKTYITSRKEEELRAAEAELCEAFQIPEGMRGDYAGRGAEPRFVQVSKARLGVPGALRCTPASRAWRWTASCCRSVLELARAQRTRGRLAAEHLRRDLLAKVGKRK